MAVHVLFIHSEGIICNSLFFFIFPPFPLPLHLQTRRALCVCSALNCWLVLHNCWFAACSHHRKSNQHMIYFIIYIISWTACPRLHFDLYSCSSTVSMSHSFGTISVTPPSKGSSIRWSLPRPLCINVPWSLQRFSTTGISCLGWSSCLHENNFYFWERKAISWELTLYAAGKHGFFCLARGWGLGTAFW